MLSHRVALRWAVLAVGLVLAAGGCSGGTPSSEPLGQTEQGSTFPNDQAAFDYFVGKGLTNFQAAGIVGNLDQESGDDPMAVQAGGPGRGIAQWSVGGRWDTSANDNAVSYAGQQGQSVWSLQLQLDFVWYELTNFSGYGLGALRATTNVTDATVAFETDFEGCGQCDQSQRIAYAQAVLAAFGAVPYAAQFVSQSFPLATTALTMAEGEVIPSYIELRNVGTKTWDSNTHLATTQPRDRDSAFADGTWLSANRPSGVTGTVPPGGTYKFTFDLAAPAMTGTFDEFFGVVEDGVTWFSDPGQGGPPDNQLEVKIDVVVPEGGPLDAGPGRDAGPPRDAGTHAADGGSAGDAGTAHGPSGDAAGGGPGGDGGAGDPFAPGSSSGCSIGPRREPPWAGGLGVMLAWGAFVRSSRRRRRRHLDSSRA